MKLEAGELVEGVAASLLVVETGETLVRIDGD
jgi:hypothetical protein